MKATAVFLAIFLIIALAFAARTVRVNSCNEDIDGKTEKAKCLSAWEPLADEDAGNWHNYCQWCDSKAVPPVCANQNQAQRLPKPSFLCTNNTDSTTRF